jgi:hypothetical protein
LVQTQAVETAETAVLVMMSVHLLVEAHYLRVAVAAVALVAVRLVLVVVQLVVQAE